MNVSVIVVCYNERDNIDQCINSLIRQDYPPSLYEVILVDNGSDDGTQKIIQDYVHQHQRMRLIVNPNRGIAGSRNLGLMAAAHDFVAFMDADCIALANWLNTLTTGFKYHHDRDQAIVAVGGSNVPPLRSSRFHDVLNIFLNTYLGSHGSVQGIRFRDDQPVPHLPTVNVLYHRPTVLQAGGFDVTFGNIGEDQDLSFRLREKGCRFYYLTKATVTHKLRPDLNSWMKNMFTYGKGRMWLMRKWPQKISPVLLLPMALVAMLPLTLLFWLSAYFLLPLSYFLVILLVSIFACRKAAKLEYFIDLFRLYVGTHLAYGAGEWFGLFNNREITRLQTSKHLIIDSKTVAPS